MLSVCQALCEGLHVFGLSKSSWPPQEEALFLPSFYRKGKPRPREVRQPAWGHTVNPARRKSSNFGSLLLESGCFESMKPYPGGPDGWWWWVPKACAGCWARALRECGRMSAFPMKKTKQKNSLPQIFYQVPTLCLALWLGPVKKKIKKEKVSILSLQLISLLCLITWALFEVVMVLTGHVTLWVLGLGWASPCWGISWKDLPCSDKWKCEQPCLHFQWLLHFGVSRPQGWCETEKPQVSLVFFFFKIIFS